MKIKCLPSIATLAPLVLVLSSPSPAAPPEGYYGTVDDASPEALRQSLHEIIDDHQRFPYTSSDTDTWDILELADESRNDANRIVTVYRNAAFGKQGGGNDFYNREHVWPKSYGFPDNDESVNYPFTDTHALFLSDIDYNFARSNHPFRSCDAACTPFPTESNDGRGGDGGAYPGNSNWQIGEFTEGAWEVWSGRRGDIARALMYMDLRYEGGVHGITNAAEPDLILTDDESLIDGSRTGQNEPVGYMGMLSVLLDWHRQDPVDGVEIQHHETVASFQGNRNPFIDNPNWAFCLFEARCGFVINAGISDAWYNPQTDGQGFLIVVWEEIQYMFAAWFTYDVERPPDGVQAMLGEPGHRWLTAQGAWSGDTAELDIFVTRGGVFDAADPPAGDADPYGSMTIRFSGCNAATVDYDIPSLNLSGEIPIERIVLEKTAQCEALGQQ
jgi:endonuclease I